MYIWIVVITFFTIVWFWRAKHRSLLHDELKFKLSALQDELRGLLLNGHIKSKTRVYEYLDNTIAGAIDNTQYFKIYRELGIGLVREKDQQYLKLRKDFLEELKDPENKSLKTIYNRFQILLLYYVVKKHILLRFLILRHIANLKHRQLETLLPDGK